MKTRNMILASGTAGAICWPNHTVRAGSMAFKYVSEPVKDFWKENGEYVLIIIMVKVGTSVCERGVLWKTAKVSTFSAIVYPTNFEDSKPLS